MTSTSGKSVLVLAALCAWLAIPASARSISDRIYNPTTAPLSLDGLPAKAEFLNVRTTDELDLKGIVVPPAGKPVLLVLHGSGTSADNVGRWLTPLAERGYGLVLAEYRGFAGNGGSPSEAGLTRDASAFLHQARKLYPDSPLYMVGHSLGGGVAFDVASSEHVDCLITIGAFAGLRELVPPLARPFITDRFDNLGALGKLEPNLPYYLLHGTVDDVIAPGNANRLHNLAVTLKREGATIVLEGQGHRPDAKLIADTFDFIVEMVAGKSASLPVGATIAPFR